MSETVLGRFQRCVEIKNKIKKIYNIGLSVNQSRDKKLAQYFYINNVACHDVEWG